MIVIYIHIESLCNVDLYIYYNIILMGCACSRKNIKIHYCVSTTTTTVVANKMKQQKRLCKKSSSMNNNNVKHDVYFNKITQGCTFRIFDYLNFKDLYECGKCCSMFKLLSSNPDLLKKFFMNLKLNSSEKTLQHDDDTLISSSYNNNNNKLHLHVKLSQTFGIKTKAINYIDNICVSNSNSETILTNSSSTSISNEVTPRFTHMLY